MKAAGPRPAAFHFGSGGHISSTVDIAVAGPMRRTFAYRLPNSMGPLEPGQRVAVPFGRTRQVGFYLGPAEAPAGVQLKEILKVIDVESLFDSELFRFCRWIADYYYANPATVLATALPPLLKASGSVRYTWTGQSGVALPENVRRRVRVGRRLSELTIRTIQSESRTLLKRLLADGIIAEDWPQVIAGDRQQLLGYRVAKPERWEKFFARRRTTLHPFEATRTAAELKVVGCSDYMRRQLLKEGLLETVYTEVQPRILEFVDGRDDVADIVPNEAQKTVADSIIAALDSGFSTTLLHGVTGSGKTLVYCLVAREVLKRGRTALILTPEIALTGTTLAYLRGFFGDQVAVIHSAMGSRERLDAWLGARSGKYRIVVGPRSAVFAPMKDLGLVIVDEEHDGSYKQDDPSPRFHGRDAAIMRSKQNNIPVVLGSASPSVESYHHARSGRYRLLELSERPSGATLPAVRVVNMKTERIVGEFQFLSYSLKKAVQQRVIGDEQVILFLNRRGYAPQLKCTACGEVPTCPHCQVKLTYHKVGRKLSCHYCGYVRRGLDTCEKCGSADLFAMGAGTQKVEEQLPVLFPDARISRMDSDSVAGRKRAFTLLRDFAAHKANLLLGTQMVTKGLDLPDVTLVGVLLADMSLDMPDFRASEKTFARLLQVAGRSGRSQRPGEVIIQTWYPEHDVIRFAAAQDFQSFYEREIEVRRPLEYPPFSRLVNFVLSAKDEKRLDATARAFAGELERQLKSHRLAKQVLGPAPCPMYRLKGVYRRHLFVKTRRTTALTSMLTEWESREARFGLPSGVKLVVDVDPDNMM